MAIQDWLSSDDPIIADAAKRVDSLTTDYQAGHYSKSEYLELVTDQLDYNAITTDIQDNDRKVKIQEAVLALIQIVAIAMAFKP